MSQQHRFNSNKHLRNNSKNKHWRGTMNAENANRKIVELNASYHSFYVAYI